MSYLSRLYNHRNAQGPEAKEKPFFSKKHDGRDMHKKTPFFQGGQPPIQRLSTEDEKSMPSTNDGRMAEDKRIQEMPIQRSGMPGKEEDKKPVQKAAMPGKEEEKPVQKCGMTGKEEKPGIMKMEMPDKKKEEAVSGPGQTPASGVQKKGEAGGASATAAPAIEAGIKSSAGKGRKMPKKTASEMSDSFGVDLSNVNIHDGGEAAQLNEALQAQAFTHGNDIYFNSGKFNPEQTEGRHLLAHELTHVIQQDRHGMLQKKEGPDAKAASKDDPSEIQKKYSIVIERGNKDWSPAEMQLLISALKRLSKGEMTVLRGYHFLRWTNKEDRAKVDKDYVDPGTEECGLHEMILKKGLFRISMYDACFGDPEAVPGTATTSGIDTGEYTILHEMGHAMQNADLRNKYEAYQKIHGKYDKSMDDFNKSTADGQDKMKPALDKLGKADDAAAEAMKNAPNLPLKDTSEMLKTQTNDPDAKDRELFADAFADFKANPEGLKKSNKKLYDYFKNGGYMNPTAKK